MVLTRLLALPAPPRHSFFLWGPRQTGKTSLLKQRYPQAMRIDLLQTELYVDYLNRPQLLREELLAREPRGLVIVDEVQRVPALLNEIHWLIENTGYVFGMCGSSARKVVRGRANLLGGRAVRYELFGLVSGEIGADFDPVRAANYGYLPRHYLEDKPETLIRSYVQDYLANEIAAEGLVRNLPAFSNFLSAAALSDAEMVSYATIARDCGVSLNGVKGYFQILEDTLLGTFLPAHTKRPKRRVIQTPKFYFADIGVVNHLAKRRMLEPGGEAFGKAFENWVFHELNAHRHYTETFYDLSYWRLASGIEVDFIAGDMKCAIEAKGCLRATSDHLKGLREVIRDHARIRRRVLVCMEQRARRTDDGIDILPASEFAARLWAGKLIPS